VAIALPPMLVCVGKGAFNGCRSLAVLELPTALQAIEREAFAHCAALASIDLSRCTSLDQIEARAFDGCTALAAVALPEHLRELEDRAFNGCTSLVAIALPAALAELGSGAFARCTALTQLAVVQTGTVAHAPLHRHAWAPLHLPMARVPTACLVHDNVFGPAGCPTLESIRIQSYGWGRARVLVRRLVLTRRVVFGWYGLAAERHCAPGGRWAESDQLAYLAEFG